MNEPDPRLDLPIDQQDRHTDRAGASNGTSTRDTPRPSPTDSDPVDAERTFALLEQFRLATSPDDWEQLLSKNSKPSGPATDGGLPSGRQKTIGRFEIHEEIGRGGCGVVFRAYDPQRQHDVALKVPLLTTLVDHELRERFLREAGATAGFDHPNLLPVHEVGNDGLLWYIVAPLCGGPDLSRWMQEQTTPVAVNTALRIVGAVADGVAYAHEHGLLHRDIKPSNILLEDALAVSPDREAQGELGFVPKLTDFGLARPIDQEQALTQSGAMVGTTLYMSPEQAEGRIHDIGPWTDIYALGAVLYELLVGQPPISGQSDLETLRRISTEPPLPIRQFRKDVSRQIEAICLKCLEKNPKRRYPTVRALRDDLMRGLQGKRTKARPRSSTARIAAKLTKWPMNAAAVLLCFGVIVLISYWEARWPNLSHSARLQSRSASPSLSENRSASPLLDESSAAPLPTDEDPVATALKRWSKSNSTAMQQLFGSYHPQIDVDQLDAAGDVVAAGQGKYRIVGWHDPATGARHVYQFVGAPFRITWHTARDVAASLRFNGRAGHLATVTSADEHRILIEHLLNRIGAIHSKAWIGLSDEVTEGEFTWVTGEPFSFSLWKDGEPNDTFNEDFVEYRRSPKTKNRTIVEVARSFMWPPLPNQSWGWNDADPVVDNPTGFIVEYDLDE